MLSDEDDPDFIAIKEKLKTSLQRLFYLEKENEQLKEEVAQLKAKVRSNKIAQNIGKHSVLLRKKLIAGNNIGTDCQKQIVESQISEDCPAVEKLIYSPDPPETTGKVEGQTPVPKPPPRPITDLSARENERNGRPSVGPPPPPPPPPSKFSAGSANVVRRVPGVMEFYHSLTRKDTRIDSNTSIAGVQIATNARNMIGEIENRSRYLMAIKSDVETQGDLIRFLTREVVNAAYKDIADVEAFVKWLDRELSYLVDERAVLKHFPEWPEQKADAMREAAFSYRDLFNLKSEVSSFKDNPKEPLSLALKRMQALQDRLERSVHNIQRTRESVSKRYRGFQIPCEWMLETGMISQLKLSSVSLVKEYMKRVTYELHAKEPSQREDLMLQGARFAFRVHQFAGGFDTEAMHAFEELRKTDTGQHEQQQTTSTKMVY
ncbi:Chup1 protein [Thalictrum thalictroides]|uniref:Chup1 protein n=1 Tax=Thalictrum thalictroides TaxID=46969 RepID=A0A7J6WYZ7_THATH|nr:Chup1 protein [Thalictrum thalictroides]